MKKHNTDRAFLPRVLGAVAALLFLPPASGVLADDPGAGELARFEVSYLTSIIDHHFSALRMTELAAGTDDERDAEIGSDDGVAATPGFRETRAKARLEDIRSIARKNNRVQREEIMAAQKMLQEWYGIEHEPRLQADGRAMIDQLTRIPTGARFDIAFLHLMSEHHLTAAHSSLDCVASADLDHRALTRYCRAIVDAQGADIDEMRELLCNEYNDCDYRPKPR